MKNTIKFIKRVIWKNNYQKELKNLKGKIINKMIYINKDICSPKNILELLLKEIWYNR